MGRYTFRLPDIGEGIAEAEIVAWHVRVGDKVDEDGRLADMMTDKATVEMESPVAGTVIEVAGEAGDIVAIGAPLVVLEVDGPGNEEADASLPPAAPAKAEAPSAPSVGTAVPPQVGAQAETAVPPSPSARVLASPAVRARARALGVDLAMVKPGAEGIVDHAALDSHLLAQRSATAPRAEPQREFEVLPGAGQQVKVIGLRRRIAENMAASKRHIPHFSYVEECDVTALEAVRAELNALGGNGAKLTVLPFILAAVCRALPEYPMINARYDDAAGVVTRYDSVHLGVAAQTDAGLMVPVIRDAQMLGVRELAAEIARLAAAARDGSAKSEELSGSTITVTSLGPLGGIATTPVINRPEVAIVGPNRIVERPMFIPDGQGGERVEKRKLMNISISCDHRVVDGADAASFIQAVKRSLESPLGLLSI